MTVSVDISGEYIDNLAILNGLNLQSFDERGCNAVFSSFPIVLYQSRMAGFITVQIPINVYLLFVSYGLVKE
jgi:hypothetical protein